MANEIVPFGKYKGKAIEAMLSDVQYCSWLSEQSWLKEKYPVVQTLIINNFGEPEETPEHNSLQGMFFEDNFRHRFIRFMSRRLKTLDHIRKHLDFLEEGIETGPDRISNVCRLSYYTDEAIVRHAKHSAECLRKNIESNSFGYEYHVESEVLGWDIGIVYRIACECFNPDIPCKDFCYRGIHKKRSVFVELKPSIGDDFPSVLRQMTNNMNRVNASIEASGNVHVINKDPMPNIFAGCMWTYYVLFYQNYDGLGVPEEIMRKQFEQKGFIPARYDEVCK